VTNPISLSSSYFFGTFRSFLTLGMMKNFVKAVDHGVKEFQYIQQKFPQITESKNKKKKSGIFLALKFSILWRKRSTMLCSKGLTKLFEESLKYLLTLFLAITGDPNTGHLFKTSF
jgi:hypothetical protein